MKNKKNIEGFGTYEFLIIALICLVLSLFLVLWIVNNQNSEKYSVFAYNAKVLGTNAVHYEMNNQTDGVIYLSDMLDIGFVTDFKNPFSGDDYCDRRETKVQFIGEEKRITMQCGDYLIKDHVLGSITTKIYKITPWEDEKPKSGNVVSKKIYNYQVEGKDVLPEYFEDALFLRYFNANNKTSYRHVDEIPKEAGVVEKTIYRTEEYEREVKY